MTHLSIKDVPDAIAAQLRERAARNHRSLQGELMAIIEQAVNEAPAPAPAAVAVASDPTWTLRAPGEPRADRQPVRRGSKTIERIAIEHRARFPEPIGAGPAAVDILRAERDAR